MQHHASRHFPLWLSIITVLLAIALGVTLAVVLRRDVLSGDTAAQRAVRSALLPDNWKTYDAQVWSMGYPEDWDVVTTAEGFTWRPAYADEGDNYLSVDVVDGYTPTDALEETSTFLFAGYETIKYTYPTYTVYVVDYTDATYRISTEFPDEPEVGIMLATFQFLR